MSSVSDSSIVDEGRQRSDRESSHARTCVFCAIVGGSSPAVEVFRDGVAVAFLDRRPLFHGHTLVVPVRHTVTLGDLASDETGPFFERVQHIAAAMPAAMACEGTFVANNNIVSQSVAHLHVHVVPRTKGDGLRGFFWPRTTYADGEAAVLAEHLRTSFEWPTRGSRAAADDGR